MNTPEIHQTDEIKAVGETKASSTKVVALRVNPWWLCASMAVLLVLLLLMWHPWNVVRATDRTVSVSGSAMLKAEPDEYQFTPSYEFKNADKALAIKDMTAKSNEVVAGLKKAGVADKDIKTTTNGYRDYYYDDTARTYTYTLMLTATSHTRDAAQKVQDYLITTSPSGSVSPQPTFSEAKRKQLETQGREAATKEARTKADQQAKNLGFTVGKVKSVSDSSGDHMYPMTTRGVSALEMGAGEDKSLAVQPGQNELTYSVEVTYYIR